MLTTFGGRSVFFVRDTPRALEYYTSRLGFAIDWTHEVEGRAFIAQVSLFGLQIILNQVEAGTESRPGHGRVFVGLDDAQTAKLFHHVEKHGITMGYAHWGEPTAVITDLDRNEIFIWLSDAERARWKPTPGAHGDP